MKIPASTKGKYEIKSNAINQSKYNIITFLPKALLYQFMRLANIYFLIIAIIQLIPVISPLTPLTAIVPILFVLAVSLTREGMEDYNRHKYDNTLNSENVLVFRDHKWINECSGNLLVGELVIVNQDNPFPADLICLDSSLHEGLCFIETGTLDGEKSLKDKISVKQTAGLFNNGGKWTENVNFAAKCTCEPPNSELYKFDGNLTITPVKSNNEELETIPIDAKQILLKGEIDF